MTTQDKTGQHKTRQDKRGQVTRLRTARGQHKIAEQIGQNGGQARIGNGLGRTLWAQQATEEKGGNLRPRYNSANFKNCSWE